MFYDLRLSLDIAASFFWIEVSTTRWVCMVCVVSALLFHIAPPKSSNINEKNFFFRNVFFLHKMVCIGLYNMGARPHGVCFHVHVLFFFLFRFKMAQPLVALMILMFHYVL